MRRAAFFDRDGTINVDVGYLHDVNRLSFIEGIPELIRYYNDLGYLVLVITNQSGIARGYYTEKDMHVLHEEINRRLQNQYGAHIDAFYYCPHHPDITGKCNCRKPEAGLFRRAQKDWDIDYEESVSYGDSERDEIASKKVGVKFYYVWQKGMRNHVQRNC